MKNVLFFYTIVFVFKFSVQNEYYEREDTLSMYFSDNEEVYKTHNLEKRKSDPIDCNNDNLTSFLTTVQIINPENVIELATTNKNLNNFCKNVSTNLEKFQTYLKSCTLTPEQENFNHILQSTTKLYKKLCKDPKYHDSFKEHLSCYSKLKNDFDSCTGPADWSENSDKNKLCKAYRDVVDCYYLKTSVLCGSKAADTFKELVFAIVDSIITVSKIYFSVINQFILYIC
uniref:Protein TsetseEP domain-containing protein n=2 Tax=Clastoptera arizonana TaxID=38151 RepID=A0A1B6CQG6_9HEMI